MLSLQKILTYAVKNGASDIHLAVGTPPAVRIDGVIRVIPDVEPLVTEHMDEFLSTIMSPSRKARFLERGDDDLAYSLPGVGRFRVNCLMQRGTVGIVMRYVKNKIFSFAELNLPPSLETICQMQRGLVLVTGTTGSGKSTTLAAIIDRINENRRCHIVTIEDPIEYLYKNKKSIVTQREVNIDTQDFHTALRAVMREDPDVILIGEMRDAETFQACISAAETGHLVLSTLHTTNVMMTVDRILDMFPTNQHQQVRSQLALQLRACISQRLLPAADGQGRVPAVEVMFNNPGIAQLIRENNVKQIPNAIAGGKEEGMQTFNMSLVDLVKKRLVTREEAELASDNPEELKMNLQGIFLSQGRGGILKR
ncbi:MAG TPA: PilT/PilU family type 4a pilus ATPase [Candidatus Hydrogenedentes bacterium]|nr:PilT/PilU family type 4a pilus ATPase [Candidatus Hydrogenedentota bacterium]HOL75577.1 PilT/PilU family type 4a pilus ATPase [Candidatus Hydrogenedentota bacterium]HPO86999.1 PilT/PilU family type 4a pilus ATPase [Candidatus Hydrogenedentota bacterium]